MRSILLLHALLLLLASTEFTIVTSVIGEDPLRWCYFKYASQSGFGYDYVSDYTLPVMLTYIVAFSVGLVGFTLALKQGRSVIGTLGMVLSILGLISFAIEGSHWILEHNRSWLALSPAAMFALVVIAWLPRWTGTPAKADRELEPT